MIALDVKKAYDNDNLRHAIIAIYLEFSTIEIAHTNFNVPTRALRDATMDLNKKNEARLGNGLTELKQDEDNYQVVRWATLYTNVSYTDMQYHTDYEMQQVIKKVFKGEITLAFGLLEYGVSKTTYYRKMKEILCLLG